MFGISVNIETKTKNLGIKYNESQKYLLQI